MTISINFLKVYKFFKREKSYYIISMERRKTKEEFTKAYTDVNLVLLVLLQTLYYYTFLVF